MIRAGAFNRKKMANTSKIQWTEATWNPWHGCKKVSPGCKFCYMYRDKERYNQDPTTVLRSKGNFDAPLKWKEPRLIFTCSWSDWFIEDADAWRPEAWDIINRTPRHTYQILTKRPERITAHLPGDWGDGYPNVWLGVSAENQALFDMRVSILSNIPATVRFVSAEPLLGPIRILEPLSSYPTFDDPGNCGEPIFWGMDWIIVGGESGNEAGRYRYRPCNTEWIAKIIGDCKEKHTRTPVFVKQLGTHLAKQLNCKDRHGGNIEEWPTYLQFREMPVLYNQETPV